MEQAVDPSRCATDVPQGHCEGAVGADHEGGPKRLTCANTAGATGLELTTCGFKMNGLPIPSQCAIKCAIWPFSGAVR
jgi:hypothetical protein